MHPDLLASAAQRAIDRAMQIDPYDVEYVLDQIRALPTERLRRKVSEWAAAKRWLPSELTNKPGRWDNAYTPYLVEIMDCLSANHPARKVAVEKAGQVGATTGLLENFIGYTIDENPGGIIYINADQDMAKMGVELKIDRMLSNSGLKHLLRAPDRNTKRSGDTANMKEFPNGFLLAFGARSAGKLRMTSAPNMVLDELDGMPVMLGAVGREEGSPITLSEKRTDAYLNRRKILYLSTPLKMQTSLIHPLFLAGDQRHFHVPCRHCGSMQPLDWHGTREDGQSWGVVFRLDDDGRLIEESIAYKCRVCLDLFYDHDKTWFLPRGQWVPHSKTNEEGLVSFHIPSFIAPPGMYHWKASCYKWLKAWDVKNDRLRDVDEFQAFYNLERGLPYEERGESPKFERVQQHRRAVYVSGQIPNSVIIRETGAPALLLTCAVDVHLNRLDVEVVAWCVDRQTYQVEWIHLTPDEGDQTGSLPWGKLSEIVEGREWVADDGRHYQIQMTLIDVGYAEKGDEVYQFCQQYSSGVYPVMGRELPPKGARVREFQESKSRLGNLLFNVTATLYKDRLAQWLASDWIEGQHQPTGYLNFPADRGDDMFREYEAEEKVAVLDPRTKQRRGFRWRQIGQRPNHAWDCRVYNSAAFDMIALAHCEQALELEKLSYPDFLNYATPRQNSSGRWLPAVFSWHPEEVSS